MTRKKCCSTHLMCLIDVENGAKGTTWYALLAMVSDEYILDLARLNVELTATGSADIKCDILVLRAMGNIVKTAQIKRSMVLFHSSIS